jgi:cytoskeletal protein RodZ
VSGVVLAPTPREPTIPEIVYEHFPRTSFSPTQLSERRKKMRPVVTWILGVSLVLIVAAGIRSAFTSHETKAPAAAPPVEETPAQAAAPTTETETPPPADETNAANAAADGKLSAAQAQHHKTSQSHRPKKPGTH